MDELKELKVEWYNKNMELAEIQRDAQAKLKALNELGAKIQKMEATEKG